MRALILPVAAVAFSGCQLAFPLGDYASGAAPCAGSGAWLCEDFENGLDAGTWETITSSAGAVGLVSRADDPDHVHRGDAALHVSWTPVASNDSVAHIRHTQPQPDDLFVRVFLFVASPFPPDWPTLMQVQQSADPYGGMSVNLTPSEAEILDWVPAPTYVEMSSTTFPTDRWVCLEWEVKQSTAEVHVWQDSAELTDLHATGLQLAPFQWLIFGSTDMPTSNTAYDVWYDDVYVDTQRVGCAK